MNDSIELRASEIAKAMTREQRSRFLSGGEVVVTFDLPTALPCWRRIATERMSLRDPIGRMVAGILGTETYEPTILGGVPRSFILDCIEDVQAMQGLGSARPEMVDAFAAVLSSRLDMGDPWTTRDVILKMALAWNLAETYATIKP